MSKELTRGRAQLNWWPSAHSLFLTSDWQHLPFLKGFLEAKLGYSYHVEPFRVRITWSTVPLGGWAIQLDSILCVESPWSEDYTNRPPFKIIKKIMIWLFWWFWNGLRDCKSQLYWKTKLITSLPQVVLSVTLGEAPSLQMTVRMQFIAVWNKIMKIHRVLSKLNMKESGMEMKSQ